MEEKLLVWANNRFEYHPDGYLIYKNNFAANARKGQRAGHTDAKGYTRINYGLKKLTEHRLIYLMHHKNLPALIDHIDQNPANNRIENLRSANKSINAVNTGVRADNKTGVKGVRFVANRYQVYITRDKVRSYVGRFKTLAEAELAYKEADNVAIKS